MDENKTENSNKEGQIVCPRCKGCGMVTPKRTYTKHLKSLNPNERYCSKCKNFKQLDCFYKTKGKISGYCKQCHNSKEKNEEYRQRKRERNKQYMKKYYRKYENICKICGINFIGYKQNQYSCSRACHMKRLLIQALSKKSNNEVIEVIKRDYKIV